MLRQSTAASMAAGHGLFRRRGCFAPRLESLESRDMLAATVIEVTTFDDVLDAGDGLTSLREAVLAANDSPADELIQLAPGTYVLTIRSYVYEDAALSGDLDIHNNGALTIVGSGAAATTIDAAGLVFPHDDGDRILDVQPDAVVELESVTLTGGVRRLFGGAIQNQGGQLTINRSTVAGNRAFSGGAIWNGNGGRVAIRSSTISNNEAYSGGGISNVGGGEMIITASTIADNEADFGGGITNLGTMTIASTTISGNVANEGAGINNYNTATENTLGRLTILSSTISENSTVWGGALTSRGGRARVTIVDTTIRGNSTTAGIGKAIHNDATMWVTAATISGGTTNWGELAIADTTISGDPQRGGISSWGDLTVTRSTIAGRINNEGRATIVDTTVVDNTVADNLFRGIFNRGELLLAHSIVSGHDGGGVANSGTATIIDSTIADNVSPFPVSDVHADGHGGGIHNTGQLLLIGSTVSGNSARIHGGAIYNGSGATVTLRDSTLADNLAKSDGGGMANYGVATISRTTLSGNTAEHFGGGIINMGTALITNSTLSGNAAVSIGGALVGNGQLTVRHSTITGNRSDADGDGIGPGGGLAVFNRAVLTHTIVAGNFFGAAPGGVPSDIIAAHGLAAASVFNLIGDPNSAGGLTHGTNGNIVGDGLGNTLDINTVLDAKLADNGGPTLTHSLVVNSPAIDAGDANFLLPPQHDQRGAPFARQFGGRIDIGAFEVQTSPGDHAVDRLVAASALNRTAGWFLLGQPRIPDPLMNPRVDHSLRSTTVDRLLVDAAESLVDLALAQLTDAVADDVMPLDVDVETAHAGRFLGTAERELT